MKKLWLDTETTGLDANKHGLIEVAGIVEVNFEVKEVFHIKMSIMDNQAIDAAAASIQGLTLEQFTERIHSYQAPLQAYRELKWIFDKYIDCYDKSDKFIVTGYNIGFDIGFLEAFFKNMSDKYLYSYISSPVDILHIVRYLSLMGIIEFEDHKLETVCKTFAIPLEAHNPMSDICATREIAYYILRQFNEDVFCVENLAKIESDLGVKKDKEAGSQQGTLWNI